MSMTKIDPTYVGPDAVQHLLQFCEVGAPHRFTLIADTNTFAALGGRVESALKGQGYDVSSIILTGKEIIADEHYLVQVLVRAPVGSSTFIAVGSGTLTDITRF